MPLRANEAAYPVDSGPSICSRRDAGAVGAFARIVSLDDVPIAGGLVVGGEPEQRAAQLSSSGNDFWNSASDRALAIGIRPRDRPYQIIQHTTSRET